MTRTASIRRAHEKRIRLALADHYTPYGVDIVMRSRNTMLGGRSPMDLLAVGGFDELDEWLSWLGDGNCS